MSSLVEISLLEGEGYGRRQTEVCNGRLTEL
jgi:hypothetical protein